MGSAPTSCYCLPCTYHALTVYLLYHMLQVFGPNLILFLKNDEGNVRKLRKVRGDKEIRR